MNWSWSHSQENQLLWSWSHIREHKSFGAGAVSFLWWLCSHAFFPQNLNHFAFKCLCFFIRWASISRLIAAFIFFLAFFLSFSLSTRLCCNFSYSANYPSSSGYRNKDSVYFAPWGKSTAGAIFPSAKYDWLKWSHDKFGMHDMLIWVPWCL